ncbi:ABC-type amino acid transport substrate-binding protein [Rhizobium sp. BK529]|uniref:amino acid ABC transporter substrate-binding protein n=1 Tax=unclassified Rhizobium TaxID=2613769 RepID=UPI00104E1D2C|nr:MULTISPECIES: amino acid ABC transporter substrate-binding protein [unclassified Rhizobium]MBB3594113.1 ABC-type amino acid transport substrate-binding protein [Rhizobium sp. BK529]TCS01567.1 amino acid ABC transporter substrate-binding protein (PAAT family) [Rhizobium sp. BK418]
MLNRARRLLFLGLALAFPAFAPAMAQTLDTIKQSKTIRIGYITDEKPFSFKKADGSPAGYTIDLCRRIADEVGHNVSGLKKEYVETTLADGFGAVENGKVDLLCGATTINLERRESVDFSQPVFLTGASALLRRDSPDYLQVLFLDKQPVSAVDLKSPAQSSIGVRAGTTTGATLRDAIGPDVPQTRIVDFATHEDGLKALEDRRIDAYFADRALLIGLADRANNRSALELGSRLFTHEPYGIAVRRDDSTFRLLVDRTLTDFYTSNDFPKLLKTYFGAEAPALRSEIMMQSIPE